MSKHRKKGFLSLIFSRTALILVLIAIQVYFIIGLYKWLEGAVQSYILIQGVLSILIVVYLFNMDMDATGKLTWLVIIMIAPIPGALLLLFVQKNAGQNYLKNRIQALISNSKTTLDDNSGLLENDELVNSGTKSLHHYLNTTGCFPIYNQTQTQYFPIGEQMFGSILEELKKAEKFIYLEYFIIDKGFMWDSILEILEEKASLGVEVKVMFDGMCEITTLSKRFSKQLKAKGIECKPFSPLTPFISTHYNYRDHRKILIIDGKVAFTGGVNIADEYINRIDRFGHWKDCGVKIAGKAVESFILMFLQMWNILEKNSDWSTCKVDDSHNFENASGYIMPYCDSPLDKSQVGEMFYCDILNRATSYVHIMTPYLILDDKIETALIFAAERGTDVKIILPGIPDKKIAYALAKSHYKKLIKNGVKIYEYTPGFVHSKVAVSDDSKAIVGTINLDYRSLTHHFECAAYMYKTDCIPSIENDFLETLSKCREVTEISIRNEKLYYKVTGALMKIFAPLM